MNKINNFDCITVAQTCWLFSNFIHFFLLHVLLFREPMRGYPNGKYYVGAAQPWRFDVADPKQVLLEKAWQAAVKYCSFQSLEQIVHQIEQPAGIVFPYPAPKKPFPLGS